MIRFIKNKRSFLKISIKSVKCSIIKREDSFMFKLYLDNCCYNRPFDDLTQEKINLESRSNRFYY